MLPGEEERSSRDFFVSGNDGYPFRRNFCLWLSMIVKQSALVRVDVLGSKRKHAKETLWHRDRSATVVDSNCSNLESHANIICTVQYQKFRVVRNGELQSYRLFRITILHTLLINWKNEISLKTSPVNFGILHAVKLGENGKVFSFFSIPTFMLRYNSMIIYESTSLCLYASF